MININPDDARKAYEAIKEELSSWEEKKKLLEKDNICCPEVDLIIQRKKEELQGCAYFAFGKTTDK